MRYLCFDIGDKRTGVASGDDDTRLAGPLDVIHSKGDDDLIQQIVEMIDRESVTSIVIGLPLNMDGSEGPRAKKTRELATRIEASTTCAIHFADERQSTQAADTMMARTGLTHKQKKNRRDALAATAILRDFLENQCQTEED